MKYRNIFISFGILVCLISITANCVLIFLLAQSFKKLQFSRIFPHGYTHFIEKSHDYSLFKNKKKTLIFIGDSRSLMWDTAPFKPEYNIKNISHGGMTSSQVLLQVMRDTIPQGEWIILQVGINDIHPIGAFKEKRELIIENCQNNIREIKTKLLTMGYKIILTTIFPPSDVPIKRRPFWDKNFDNIILNLNKFIMSLNDNNKVFVVDAYNLLLSEDNKLDDKFRDKDFFLHVNSNAYLLLNKEINKFIYITNKNVSR